MPPQATRARRAAQLAGLLGGLEWVLAALIWDGSHPVTLALFWIGAVLVTVFLLGIGLQLVKRGLFALRLFVACALPLLFWMVAVFAAGAMSDAVVWGFAGTAVVVFAIVQLARPVPVRATL